MRTIFALCVLLAGCATTGAVATPEVIYTPDDDLIVQVQATCWKVTAIDYDRAQTEPDDLAYATVEKVVCPRRKVTQ